METVLENSQGLTSRIMQAVHRSHPMAKAVVRDVIEANLFPWYEAHYGATLTDRGMRVAVGKKIEEALATVVFVPVAYAKSGRQDDLGLPRSRTAPTFVVEKVQHAYAGNGYYHMVCVLSPHGPQAFLNLEKQIVPLSQLLTQFVPSREIDFSDYNG